MKHLSSFATTLIALLLAFALCACSNDDSGGGSSLLQPGATVSQTYSISLMDNPLTADALADLKVGTIDASDWFSWTSVARAASGDVGFSKMTVKVEQNSTVSFLIVTLTITAGSEERDVTISVKIPATYTESGTEVTKTVATISVATASTSTSTTTPTSTDTTSSTTEEDSDSSATETSVSYGTSTLPNLSSSSAFSGKSFIEFDEGMADDGYFFGTDGTLTTKGGQGHWDYGSNGSYSCRFWQNATKFTYAYNPTTKVLNLKMKGFYAEDDTLVTSADEYVSVIKKQYESKYATVNIAPEYIAAEKQFFSNALQQQGSVVCSISDGALVFTDSTANEGKYRYTEGNLRIKFSCKQGEYFSLDIENGSARLHEPIIMSMGNGTFSGSDFNVTISDDMKSFTITKLGDFSGTYSEQSDGCHFTLTSATGDIDDGIKALIGTEYILPQRTDENAESYLYPVLKTVNYTVIGSDGKIATTNSEAYITDASETIWSLNTLQVLSANYIEDIYLTRDCTQSVIGTAITDGAYVYVKLRELTADAYKSEVHID